MTATAARSGGGTNRLEVHHVDDDPTNDRPDNLEVRCFAHNPRGRQFWFVDRE